jgi:hypothetical protein
MGIGGESAGEGLRSEDRLALRTGFTHITRRPHSPPNLSAVIALANWRSPRFGIQSRPGTVSCGPKSTSTAPRIGSGAARLTAAKIGWVGTGRKVGGFGGLYVMGGGPGCTLQPGRHRHIEQHQPKEHSDWHGSQSLHSEAQSPTTAQPQPFDGEHEQRESRAQPKWCSLTILPHSPHPGCIGAQHPPPASSTTAASIWPQANFKQCPANRVSIR